jgi:hypothetical protein
MVCAYCDRPSVCKSMCQTHYMRTWRTGSPHLPEKVAPTLEQVLARTTPNGECLEWTGSINGAGYGELYLAERYAAGLPFYVRVHRWVLEQICGPLDVGLEACHTCDNPPCINPEHLFPGTHRENALDRMSKGRPSGGASYPGEKHHRAKLTESDVRRMLAEREKGATYPELMKEFGVGKSTVADICKRRTWQHLT